MKLNVSYSEWFVKWGIQNIYFKIKMSKCEHGQKITTFCASECCVWKEAGGCNTCIKKYHNHMGPTIFITEDEAQQLIKKFNVDPASKPKCRSLQQAIFNYFNLLKTQFVSFIDNACMDIINQIGHPYLTHNNLLTTYKRIKKKDYKKIQQKQFRHFYQASQKISQNQLIENQRRIYVEKVKKKSEFISSLEKLMRGIEKINADHEQNYLTAHDGSINLKITEIVKSILKGKLEGSTGGSILLASSSNQSQRIQMKSARPDYKRQKIQKTESLPLTDSHQFISTQKSQNSKKESDWTPDYIKQKEKQKHKQDEKFKQKLSPKLKEKQKEKQEKQRQKQKQKQKEKQKQQKKKPNRFNSIDKHFIKTNNLQKKKQVNDVSLVNKIIPQHDTPDRKQAAKQDSSPKRRAFESKQVEINERKQKLIDMMKQKQKQEYTHVRLLKVPDAPLQTSNKDSQNKLSQNGSGSSFEQKDDKLHLFAHTILPRTQSRRKLFQESEQVAQKTIIVPVEEKLEGNKTEECVSPLLKYKFKSKEFQRSDSRGSKPKQSKQLIALSPVKKGDSKDELIQLSDPESKSIALLVKSLSVKAQQAIPYLQSALQYAEDNLSAAQYLSYLYLESERPKECLTICNKVLEKLSHSETSSELSWHFNINKSAALNKLGRYSESIVTLEECLKFKQQAKLFKNLGDAYFSIGIFQKSNYYYEKAVGLEDNYDQAHYNLAVCLFMQENFHNAKFSILKALHYSPKNEVYLQLQKEISLRIKDF